MQQEFFLAKPLPIYTRRGWLCMTRPIVRLARPAACHLNPDSLLAVQNQDIVIGAGGCQEPAACCAAAAPNRPDRDMAGAELWNQYTVRMCCADGCQDSCLLSQQALHGLTVWCCGNQLRGCDDLCSSLRPDLPDKQIFHAQIATTATSALLQSASGTKVHHEAARGRADDKIFCRQMPGTECNSELHLSASCGVNVSFK